VGVGAYAANLTAYRGLVKAMVTLIVIAIDCVGACACREMWS
jgi:hypothetical protein